LAVGKSTLVRALCHEPAVRRRYPDGILWAELNQEPNLLERLTEWLEVLGDAASRPTSISAATVRLRVLLDERADFSSWTMSGRPSMSDLIQLDWALMPLE